MELSQIPINLSVTEPDGLITVADRSNITLPALRRWAGLRYADLISGTA